MVQLRTAAATESSVRERIRGRSDLDRSSIENRLLVESHVQWTHTNHRVNYLEFYGMARCAEFELASI